MNESKYPQERWEQLAAEFQAYRDLLHDTWGDLEDLAIANYLAGNPSDEEKLLVESALSEKPAVREMVEAVREALVPAWVPAELKGMSGKTLSCRLQARMDASRIAARGAEGFLRGAEKMVTMALGPKEQATDEQGSNTRLCRWEIPLEEFQSVLMVCLENAAETDSWFVSCDVSSETEPEIVDRVRFSIGRPNDIPLVQAQLKKYAGTRIEIASGEWELKLHIDKHVRIVPLEIGRELQD